jgi:drug/metabolite transporter (DMT)-like permease
MPLFILIPTCFGAIITIYLRKFAGKIKAAQNSGYFFMFGSMGIGLAASMVYVPADGRSLTVLDLIFIGLGTSAHNTYHSFVTLANKYESRTSYVAMLLSTQIVFTFIVDYIVFDSEIRIFNIVGAVLVMMASIFIAVSKEKVNEQTTDDINRADEKTLK